MLSVYTYVAQPSYLSVYLYVCVVFCHVYVAPVFFSKLLLYNHISLKFVHICPLIERKYISL